MLYAPIQIITSQTMAAAISSRIVALPLYFGYAVQATYTTSGTLGGSFAIQVSVDHDEDLNGNVTRAGTFVTLANSTVVITGAGSYIWNVSDSNYAYFKLIYTPAGGDTGTCNAFATIKGF
jgi:hypothetical protein